MRVSSACDRHGGSPSTTLSICVLREIRGVEALTGVNADQVAFIAMIMGKPPGSAATPNP